MLYDDAIELKREGHTCGAFYPPLSDVDCCQDLADANCVSSHGRPTRTSDAASQ